MRHDCKGRSRGQRHSGTEHSRRPLHVGGHSNAGWREVYREQDVPNRRHGFGSRSGFNKMIGLL